MGREARDGASWHSDLEPPAAPRKRERVLTEEEIKAIWPHLQGSHGEVMKWLLWTGCRLNEAAGMTFGEIQADRWTIPAARSKSKRERVIPLPTQAIALFHSCGGGDCDFPLAHAISRLVEQ